MTSISRGLARLAFVGATLLTSLATAGTWDSELPSADAVLRAIHGASAQDTAAQQAAAFSVLLDAIEVLSGHSEFEIAQMPARAQRAMNEYRAARGQAIKAGHLSNMPVDHYFFSKPFREQIVARHLSPASQAAYWRVRSVNMFGNGTSQPGLQSVTPQNPLSGAETNVSSLVTDAASTVRSYATMGIALVVVLVLLGFAIKSAIGANNGLGPMRQKIREQESNCKIVLDKKATLINEQYQVAQRFGEIEQMMMLQISSDVSASGLRALAMQSGALLQSVQHAAERFPNLKSNEQYNRLSQAISECENEIQRYRQQTNLLVREFNSAAGQFPRVVFARLLGFKDEAFLDLDVSQARFQAQAPVLTQTEGASRLNHVLGLPPGAAAPPAALPPYANTGRQLPASQAPAPYAGQPPQLAAAHSQSAPPAVSARGGGTTAFSMPQLAVRFLSGPLGGRTVPIGGSGAIIGREPQAAQIVVADAQVSSAHAWIGMRSQGFVFMDRGSTNGSIVNGESIQPNREVVLKQGDVITLGRQNSVSFVVEQAS
jgi:LemA protein